VSDSLIVFKTICATRPKQQDLITEVRVASTEVNIADGLTMRL